MVYLKTRDAISWCVFHPNKKPDLDSQPSTVSSYPQETIPAFMTSISRRLHSRWNLSTKRVTEEKSARSTVHGSHDLKPVADSISGRHECTRQGSAKCRTRKLTRNGSHPPALAATRKDEFSGTHTREMRRSFEADACVGTDDDDRFSCQIRALNSGDPRPLFEGKAEKCLLHRVTSGGFRKWRYFTLAVNG